MYVTGLAPDIPEDLYYMIKKAVVMRKHLEVNRKDKDGKFRLILVESRIHRLARYYKVGSPSFWSIAPFLIQHALQSCQHVLESCGPAHQLKLRDMLMCCSE